MSGYVAHGSPSSTSIELSRVSTRNSEKSQSKQGSGAGKEAYGKSRKSKSNFSEIVEGRMKCIDVDEYRGRRKFRCPRSDQSGRLQRQICSTSGAKDQPR